MNKKLPVRMCIACHEQKLKKELMRIVKNKENEITLDFTGKKPGRGAYICDSQVCIEKCIKGKILNRAFDMQISDEIYAKLKEDYEQRKD